MPTGISLDDKRDLVCVADTGNGRIQIFDKKGRFVQFVQAPGLEFKTPQGLALSGSREMAISDPEADRVWLITI
jgi:hypothetical protein